MAGQARAKVVGVSYLEFVLHDSRSAGDRAGGMAGQGRAKAVDVSYLEFVLHDSGNTKTGHCPAAAQPLVHGSAAVLVPR